MDNLNVALYSYSCIFTASSLFSHGHESTFVITGSAALPRMVATPLRSFTASQLPRLEGKTLITQRSGGPSDAIVKHHFVRSL